MVAQQQAAAYMALFQQRQLPFHHTEHVMDNQPQPPSSQDQRDQLGPLQWIPPNPTYPGFPAAAAAMYGGPMQQLFQPAAAAPPAAPFHQPPPPPPSEEETARGLFIPPVAPEQQRMMQQNMSSQKQSQAIPIVDPKLVSLSPLPLYPGACLLYNMYY